MAVLTREQILARKVAGVTEEVDLGDGSSVIVRGLSRREASETSKVDDDFEEVEILALHYGLVDPPLSVDDVRAWRAGDQSENVQKVVSVIQRLSGSAPGQGKDATKSVPRRRRAGA